jgi:hypothetical protein
MFPRLSAKVVAFVMAGGAFGLVAAGAEPTYIAKRLLPVVEGMLTQK